MFGISDALAVFGGLVIAYALYELCAIVNAHFIPSRPTNHIEITILPSKVIACPVPALKFSKVKENVEETIQTECVVGLSSFEDEEDVRQLPGCRHCFHSPCIDMWLYYHFSCPICRKPVEPLDSDNDELTAKENSMEDL